MTDKLTFVHRFEPQERLGVPPLLLLHGTGGDENDLLPLGRMISPASAFLSVRGQVLENGMPRFFRRLAEGVFDESDVKRRALELADFVDAARAHYKIEKPVALGYSNGANVAAAAMLLRPETFAGGILLRAMVPLSKPPRAGLAGAPVLILSGQRDPIASPTNSARLAEILTQAGAQVDRRVVTTGHELSQMDVVQARSWLQSHFASAGEPAASVS